MSQRNEGHDPHFPYYLPTSRIAEILRRAAAEAGFPLDETTSGGREWITHRTGVPVRRVYGILIEEGPTVTFDTVDRILIGLDLMDLWHLSPEEGGLADFYEASEENPAPPLPKHNARQRAHAKKYNDRRNARLRRQRAELAAKRRAWLDEEEMAVAG